MTRPETVEQIKAERKRLAAVVKRVEALADEWDERAKSLGPCTGPNCGGCRLGAAASHLRAALSDAGRGK